MVSSDATRHEGELLCFCVLGSPSMLPSDIQHSLQERDGVLGESRAPEAATSRGSAGSWAWLSLGRVSI